ncbi:alpha-L-fucosidase [Panacibacter ginsenosidivorans]|uniref:alpha-L-fucosidase n=1 Tax=Panacibacter ginsenosidivorans TaxID=1813871 RepID=A0A5B8V648_9BACT|nr:alpha-L-fucosidase [Panacibacter ginsenosidivorans]QEC66116.1 alpha-L-fucosidase [Panacibacter ginsenosidivorans]
MAKKNLLTSFLLSAAIASNAQQHNFNNSYVKPTDTLVQQKIEQWQDLKFGLFMHWGTYSQWGVVESWSICPEDEGWTQRRGPYAASYNGYVKAYENLQTTFNPVNFNPDKWAAAAKDAGMKYVVFTTKHHDGFCMFDTKQTDYKITSSKTPFSSNTKSNVTKEIFNAFRKDGFLTGAYFSKPDWHSPDYWWPYFPPKDRNVNYDPAKYPERWNAFKDYTYNQIKELMTDYGKVDVLWLDGGWVRPLSSVDTTVEWQRGIKFNQDIDMARIAKMARTYQPGLMVVDRTVSGEFENYVTPEQTIPNKPLDYPWESCITMGNSWSYVPNDEYKSANTIVHLLLRIVSRGGNLLLNIGPSPLGDFSDTAYDRLRDIGTWMKVHGEAVYGTKPLAPYEDGNVLYLQSKDSKTVFVYVLSNDKNDDVVLPAAISLKNISLTKKSKILCLDAPKEKIKFTSTGDASVISVPAALQNQVAGKYAVAFKITL